MILKTFMVVAFIVFYLCTGYCIAWMRTKTGMARRAAAMHNKRFLYRVQSAMRQQFYAMIFAWPVYFPVSLIFAFFYLFMPSPNDDLPDGGLHVIVTRFRSHVDNMIESNP